MAKKARQPKTIGSPKKMIHHEAAVHTAALYRGKDQQFWVAPATPAYVQVTG
jgi:hypothetical protein